MGVHASTCVLVVAAGASWESEVLAGLGARPGLIVLRRCVDVTDLLAAATSGQAHVAVVSADASDVDAPALDHLRRHGVRTVAVVDPGHEAARARVGRLGVDRVVGLDRLDTLPDMVLAAAGEGADEAPPVPPAPDALRTGPESAAGVPGPAIGVWGPAGAPGRTTVALGIAGELARRGRDPLLLDVDPWGGAVAQHLGVLDEVSGLLAGARYAASDELATRFGGLQRRVGDLRVLTGLPRADRWAEVRAGTVERLVELGRRQGPVVVDTGFALEEGPAELTGRAGRNDTTLEALAGVDVLVVVGSADPVGLARLARGLVELRELVGGRPLHVVVNRMRRSLGWSAEDITGMVAGFARVTGQHFLPDDQPAADRALLTGETVATTGADGPLGTALSELVDAVAPGAPPAPDRRRLRRRRAGRGRRR